MTSKAEGKDDDSDEEERDAKPGHKGEPKTVNRAEIIRKV